MCRSDEERERLAGRIEKEIKTRTRTLLRLIPFSFWESVERKEGLKVKQFQSNYLRCLGTFYISILARYENSEIRHFKLIYVPTFIFDGWMDMKSITWEGVYTKFDLLPSYLTHGRNHRSTWSNRN